MGEGLYAHIIQDSDVKVSIYAPVGPHKDLLPYLVRRLLENGANSSFVNQLLDKDMQPADIVRDPVAETRGQDNHRHPSIPLPKDIFGQARRNSTGVDFDDPASSQKTLDYIASYKAPMQACSIIAGKKFEEIDERFIDRSFKNARAGFHCWNAKHVQDRNTVILRFSDLLEENAPELTAILVHEGGKTIVDAHNEIREAVDFCRYYAHRAALDFAPEGVLMPGYTGETNRLTLQGRGVFVCISPWNFPLAIFTGQIIAALAAGNAVIAKPASQTRYIAMRCVELMHEAGVPPDVVALLLGNGAFGSNIIAHKNVAGVAFTGSTATAKHIQKTITEHNNAIIPFIAETGGQNAMIVDSSALPEQVVDDVIASAFGSAGQRCSALRVLYVQDDIADNIITLLKGAMRTLRVSNPASLSTDVGYIIDENAKVVLDAHMDYISKHGTLIAQAEIDENISDNSQLFAPVAYEIPHIDVLKEEVFGPALHVIRYGAAELDNIIAQINDTGYGLTCGIHSRIQTQSNKISSAVNAGNIYINRSMTGAVVGVQPFGGMGLSGTGPKAGGPRYLHAFAVEKTMTTDTTASGGNAGLVSL